MGFIVGEGRGQAFGEALNEALLRRGVSVLDLEHVPEGYYLPDLNGYERTVLPQDICPRAELPATWDEYAGRLQKRFRKNVDYYWRRINRDFQVRYEIVSTQEQVEPTLRQMMLFHQRRWHGRGLPGAFRSHKLVRFHLNAARGMLERGYLDLHRLVINDQVAAVLYCFHKGTTTYYYLSGFDQQYRNMSLGTVLTSMAIKTAIERGDHVFDFLRGNEAYKQDFCLTSMRNNRIVYTRGVVGGVSARYIALENRVVESIKARFEV
jgi:CelD/BcsL family acetyltransferase involved in cellulose biosynthesis